MRSLNQKAMVSGAGSSSEAEELKQNLLVNHTCSLGHCDDFSKSSFWSVIGSEP